MATNQGFPWDAPWQKKDEAWYAALPPLVRKGDDRAKIIDRVVTAWTTPFETDEAMARPINLYASDEEYAKDPGGAVLEGYALVDANDVGEDGKAKAIDLGDILRAVEGRSPDDSESLLGERPDRRIVLRGCRIEACHATRLTIRPPWSCVGATFGAVWFTNGTIGDHARFDGTFFEHAWFDGATFGNHARFAGASFGYWARFGGAKFGHHSRFAGATFGHWASFTNATFGHDARFDGATFGEGVRFDGAAFGDEARFRGANFGHQARFGDARFGERAWLGGVTFGNEAWFGGASFGEGAAFAGTTFGLAASFDGATFGGGTRFDGARLDAGARFVHAIFGAGARLDGARFGIGARFDGANFGHHAHFDGAMFSDLAWFAGATFGPYCSFDQARVGTPADFFDCRFTPPGGIGGLVVASRHPYGGEKWNLLQPRTWWWWRRIWWPVAAWFDWSIVRSVGALQVLTRASYLSMVLVPLIAGCWPGVRYMVEVWAGIRTPTTTPPVDDPALPLGWVLAYFAAVFVFLGHMLYQVFAAPLVKEKTRDSLAELRMAQFRSGSPEERRVMLTRAFAELRAAAEKLPEVRHPSFVKRDRAAVWVPKDEEEYIRYRSTWNRDTKERAKAADPPVQGDKSNKGDAGADARPPLSYSPRQMRLILIDEGSKAEYDMAARQRIAWAGASAFFYFAGLYCLAWLLSNQVTAVLKESDRWSLWLPNWWAEIGLLLLALWLLLALGWCGERALAALAKRRH